MLWINRVTGQKEQSNETIGPDARVTWLTHLFVRQQEKKGGERERKRAKKIRKCHWSYSLDSWVPIRNISHRDNKRWKEAWLWDGGGSETQQAAFYSTYKGKAESKFCESQRNNTKQRNPTWGKHMISPFWLQTSDYSLSHFTFSASINREVTPCQ